MKELPPLKVLSRILETKQLETRQGWTSLMETIEKDVQLHEFPYVMPVGKNTESRDSALIFVSFPYPNFADEKTSVIALTPDGPYVYENSTPLPEGISGMDDVLKKWLENPKRRQKQGEGFDKITQTLYFHTNRRMLKLEHGSKLDKIRLANTIQASTKKATSEGKVSRDVEERKRMKGIIAELDEDVSTAKETIVFLSKE
jgi:hypothetical protein